MDKKDSLESILWFIDLSAPPTEVLKNIEEYKSGGIRIHIYYIGNDVSVHPSWYGSFDPEHAKDIHGKAYKKPEKRLDQICDRYLSGCSYHKRHIPVGESFNDVLESLKKDRFDLAVFSKGADKKGSIISKLKNEIKNKTKIPVEII